MMTSLPVSTEEFRVHKVTPASLSPPKMRKQLQELHQQQHQQLEHEHLHTQPSFGICFDVDGVLARGTVPIPAAVSGFRRLVDEQGQAKYPIAYVTNSLNRNSDKAAQLSTILGVQVNADQLIQAQGPLEVFRHLHDKFCLVVGQGKILDIADELGFKNVCTVEEIADAYPLLDMVDHDNRRKIATQGYVEKEFRPIEAVILLGEPKGWESALQILVDVLRSGGRPNQVPATETMTLCRQLPVVACNMDLQFQHSAPMPRYGHGAFLVCLEALYKKITGQDLQYTALIGKPSEITFRFAEHVLTSQSRKLGFTQPITTMYLIGDTPEVDVVGTNLYQRYVNRLSARRQRQSEASDAVKSTDVDVDALPQCRTVPDSAPFHPQTVDTVVPLLVRTGVYHGHAVRRHESTSSDDDLTTDDEEMEEGGGARDFHGHRDLPNNTELRRPSRVCDDVAAAIDFILDHEMV